ncbi:peroxidase [Pleomorphovibrio marinus]|uniref:peroxidase n=1 Tax=Pleomorphovibrio marinus TaxID=2164132 RepID=UPI000E0C383C|nr:peroxidase [Pleomorphovibrio marinus]
MSLIHRGLTLSFKVEENHLEQVNELLEAFNRQQPSKESLPDTFFISWLGVPPQVYAEKEKLPARILLMSSYVGSKRKHLQVLVEAIGEELRQVLAFTVGFPKEQITNKSLVRFLAKSSKFNTYYSGFKFISPKEVIPEKNLREWVYGWVEKQLQDPNFGTSTPQEIKDRIENAVEKDPNYNWAMKKPKGLGRSKWAMLSALGLFGLLMVLSLFIALVSIWWNLGSWVLLAWLFPFFIVSIFLLLVLLRKEENIEPPPIQVINDKDYLEIVSREKNKVVNEMTVIAPLKPGKFRRVFLAVSLRLVAMIRYFTYIPTVHTARWLQLDGGKRLVFIATFDNQSEAYAHDFVDSEQRSRNLAVIFSHVMGFPKTTWLIKRGENYRKDYMKGVRSFQFKTRFWYAFNTDLSVENLKNNRAFRLGLHKKMKEHEIRRWLLRL